MYGRGPELSHESLGRSITAFSYHGNGCDKSKKTIAWPMRNCLLVAVNARLRTLVLRLAQLRFRWQWRCFWLPRQQLSVLVEDWLRDLVPAAHQRVFAVDRQVGLDNVPHRFTHDAANVIGCGFMVYTVRGQLDDDFVMYCGADRTANSATSDRFFRECHRPPPAMPRSTHIFGRG